MNAKIRSMDTEDAYSLPSSSLDYFSREYEGHRTDQGCYANQCNRAHARCAECAVSGGRHLVIDLGVQKLVQRFEHMQLRLG